MGCFTVILNAAIFIFVMVSLIRWFEQLGWATNVVLPSARELEARRSDVRIGLG